MALKFEKEKRMLRRSDYTRLFENAEHIRFPKGILLRKGNSLEAPRLGISIKNSKNAVIRNLLKRKVRDFFRHNQMKLGSFDYHVVIRADEIDRATASDTTEKLEKAFREIT